MYEKQMFDKHVRRIEDREIPSDSLPCHGCGGDGCQSCNFTGWRYPVSEDTKRSMCPGAYNEDGSRKWH